MGFTHLFVLQVVEGLNKQIKVLSHVFYVATLTQNLPRDRHNSYDMKQYILILTLLSTIFTGCKNDSAETELVSEVIFPAATESFAPGDQITIQGTGFTNTDQILFSFTRAIETLAASIVSISNTHITFTVPKELPAATHSILLQRGSKQMVLGTITIKEQALPARLYGFGWREDHYAIFQINKQTGQLTDIQILDDYIYSIVAIDNTIYGITDSKSGTSCLCSFNLTDHTWRNIAAIGDLYDLVVIDNHLYALLIDETNRLSLITINEETGTQTPIAKFEEDILSKGTPRFIYSKQNNMLISSHVGGQESPLYLISLNLSSKKGSLGNAFDGAACHLFCKGNEVYTGHTRIINAGTLQEAYITDFVKVNVSNLSLGEKVGEIDGWWYEWLYDNTSDTMFGTCETDKGRFYTIGAFNFKDMKYRALALQTAIQDLIVIQ